jgi:hypothetical protein
MKYYPKVKKFVKESFAKNGKFGDELRHFWRTAYWMKRLYPKADEAMLIAAVAHDIERAYRKGIYTKKFAHNFLDRYSLYDHPRGGAVIMKKFLLKHGAPKAMAAKVAMMIQKHETGGNKWQNLLKDADSISYFDKHYKGFIKKHLHIATLDVVRQKFDWMYSRITSPQGKRLAKPMYKQSIKYLNKSYKTL